MTARRSALGKGLGALISTPSQARSKRAPETADVDAPAAPGTSAPASGAQPSPNNVERAVAAPTTVAPLELPIDLIDPNPEQPRRHFDPEGLAELAASIEQHGILQPVVVQRAGDRYQLIVGERRWRASQRAGRKTVPAVIAEIDSSERLELAIVENVQRRDLNPIELATAYRALADAGYTQDEIGKKVSLDRSSVANHLRLLDLSRDLQEDIEVGRISMGHAKALLQVPDPERRRQLRNRVVSERLSVRDTEQMGRQIAGPAPPRRSRKAAAEGEGVLDADTRALVDRLQQHLQTRVQLKSGPGKSGRIEISYFDLEELERLTDLLLGGRS